jgi:hypothetical protein
VTLTVQDEVGQTQTKPQTITVGTGAPTARLLILKTGGNDVAADGCASTAVGGAAIVEYSFGWGDGTQPTVGQTCNVQHTFVGVGAGRTFTVTLTVKDSVSPPRTNTTTASVTVP